MATVLLISLALILAVIIFIWAKSFVQEKIQKDLGGGLEAIEEACNKINFEAEAFILADDPNSLRIDLVNHGNVPIYNIEVRKKAIGSVKNVASPLKNTISNGESGSVTLAIDGDYDTSTELIVVPIILGQAGSNVYKKAFVCDETVSKEIQVQDEPTI